MKVTSDKVLSISGINMVKKVITKHIELMSVCQSHSFELFVSLTNLVRFYAYIVTSVFVPSQRYNRLLNDAMMTGKSSTVGDSSTGQSTQTKIQVSLEEKDRAN